MHVREKSCIILRAIFFLPNYVSDKTSCSKNLIHRHLERRLLIIINRYKYHPIFPQEFMKQLKTWIHHAEPFVMPREVFPFFSDDFSEPFFDLGIVDIVIIHPPFISCVVGRVYVDAFDLAFVLWQERLKCSEIVSLDDHISRICWLLRLSFLRIEAVCVLEYLIRHILVVCDDFVFSYPVKSGHVSLG